jgi:PAS domain S-box-containing protein
MLLEKSGYTFVEMTSLSPQQLQEMIHPDDREVVWNRMLRRLSGIVEPARNECRFVVKDGSVYWADAYTDVIQYSGRPAIQMFISDITERRQAEIAIKESELKYRTIFENAMEGIYQVTAEGRFITVNNALSHMAGYDSPEEFIESIRDVKQQLYVRPEDRDRFLEIIKKEGFIKGFETEFYRKNRSTFRVVINAVAVRDEQGNLLYNEGLIEDITLRKQAEERLQQSIEILKKEVNTTIHVLVTALEARDPYTAGHQSRSANLACAIATEMGLARDKIDGLRMAGVIHDIGKLTLPVEILSKPSKLTNLEFSLIKEHSHSGFEMLKDLESVWPLAQIVYQHHERMDGSGYPRNLKGDEIIIEARILAVADVVEAMASHRPYRASLGIESALDEIERHMGTLYDEAVVEACLRLFREKGYKLT